MASSHGLSSLALQALEWGQGSVPGDSAPAQRAKAGHGCHQSSQGMETLPQRGLAQGVPEATFPDPTLPSAPCRGMRLRPAGLRHRCQAQN